MSSSNSWFKVFIEVYCVWILGPKGGYYALLMSLKTIIITYFSKGCGFPFEWASRSIVPKDKSILVFHRWVMGGLNQTQQGACDANNGRVLHIIDACCDKWTTRTQSRATYGVSYVLALAYLASLNLPSLRRKRTIWVHIHSSVRSCKGRSDLVWGPSCETLSWHP